MKILALILVMVATGVYGDTRYRVIDGDTIEVPLAEIAQTLPEVISIRLGGINTPELHSRCPEEIVKAKEARTLAIAELSNPAKAYRPVAYGWDKYGGRAIGDFVSADGSKLSDVLLRKGLAVPYSGIGHKPTFCPTQ